MFLITKFLNYLSILKKLGLVQQLSIKDRLKKFYKRDKDLLKLLVVYTLFKPIFIIIAYLINPENIYSVIVKWDSLHFLRIATVGYANSEDYAFSYLYPFLIKVFSYLFYGNYVFSSIFISNLFGYLTIIVFYKTYGYKATFILAFFPTFLLYSFVPYSDTVTLFFIALTLYLLKGRENNIKAMISYSLSILSSYTTAITLPAFFLKKYRRFIVIPLILGEILFMFFKASTGDFLGLFYIEHEYWGTDFTTPWGQIKWLLNGWFTSQNWSVFGYVLKPIYWITRNLAFEAFFLASLYPLFRRDKFEFSFSLLIIIQLLLIIGVPAISIPRLILKSLPSFYGISIMLDKKFYVPYATLGLILSVLFFIQQSVAFFA
jgi:hypothetical protein